jgi:hypothetical protein
MQFSRYRTACNPQPADNRRRNTSTVVVVIQVPRTANANRWGQIASSPTPLSIIARRIASQCLISTGLEAADVKQVHTSPHTRDKDILQRWLDDGHLAGLNTGLTQLGGDALSVPFHFGGDDVH